jgi:hypothetical protein
MASKKYERDPYKWRFKKSKDKQFHCTTTTRAGHPFSYFSGTRKETRLNSQCQSRQPQRVLLSDIALILDLQSRRRRKMA